MISKDEAEFVKARWGLELPTWLDAEDMDPAAAALARAVKRRLTAVMSGRSTLRRLIREHRRDAKFLLPFLDEPKEITETLPERMSLREAAERLADAEEQLEPLVVALHEATDEPHP